MPTLKQQQELPNLMYIPLLDGWATNPPKIIMYNIATTIIQNMRDTWVRILIDSPEELTPEEREEKLKTLFQPIGFTPCNAEVITIDEFFKEAIKNFQHRSKRLGSRLKKQKQKSRTVAAAEPESTPNPEQHTESGARRDAVEEPRETIATPENNTPTDTVKLIRLADAVVKWLSDERGSLLTTQKEEATRESDKLPSCAPAHVLLFKLSDIIYATTIRNEYNWPKQLTFCCGNVVVLRNSDLIQEGYDFAVNPELNNLGSRRLSINLASYALNVVKTCEESLGILTAPQFNLFDCHFYACYDKCLGCYLEQETPPQPVFEPCRPSLLANIFKFHINMHLESRITIDYSRTQSSDRQDQLRCGNFMVLLDKNNAVGRKVMLEDDISKDAEQCGYGREVIETLHILARQVSPHNTFIASDSHGQCGLPATMDPLNFRGMSSVGCRYIVYNVLGDSKVIDTAKKPLNPQNLPLCFLVNRAYNNLCGALDILTQHVGRDENGRDKILHQRIPHTTLEEVGAQCHICDNPGISDKHIKQTIVELSTISSCAETTLGDIIDPRLTDICIYGIGQLIESRRLQLV